MVLGFIYKIAYDPKAINRFKIRAAVTVVVYYVGGFIVVNTAVILQMEYYFFTHLGAYIRVQFCNLRLAYVVVQRYIPQNFRALFSVYFFSCFHIFTLSEHKEKRPKIERFKNIINFSYIALARHKNFLLDPPLLQL